MKNIYLLLLAVMMTACSCTTLGKKEEELDTCMSLLKERISSLKEEGYEIAGSEDQITEDGAVVSGVLINGKKGLMRADVLVDNGKLVKMAEQEGFKQIAQCKMGEGTWTLLTKAEAVKTIPGKDI